MFNTISHMKKRDEGFTLIELMIVMVVLGILAGIIIFAVGPFQDSANSSKSKANAQQCKTAAAAAAAASANGSASTANNFIDGGSGC